MAGRRAARTDSNQSEIVEALRKCGVSVFPTHTVGDGFPDLVCGFHGNNYLFEIKDPNKPPSKRLLTEDEKKFRDAWRGRVFTIMTADEALATVGAIKR